MYSVGREVIYRHHTLDDQFSWPIRSDQIIVTETNIKISQVYNIRGNIRSLSVASSERLAKF